MTTAPVRDSFVILCDTPDALREALDHVIRQVRPSPMPQFRLSFDLPRKHTAVMREFFEKGKSAPPTQKGSAK